MKNDHTYEYRVFTNRLVDVGPMEVGNCTKKVVENLKSKDKVDGRFFHTSDTNEWFFCWNGKLQELNLSGDASVNEALKKVKELIGKADETVGLANDAAAAANEAVKQAQEAADAATSAVESIENKADQDYVDAVKQDVESLAQKVENKASISDLDNKANKSDLKGLATESYVVTKIAEAKLEGSDIIIPVQDVKVNGQTVVKDMIANIDLTPYAKSEDVPSIKGLATEQWVTDQKYLTQHQDISGKQDKIDDLKEIRDGAAAGATAVENANSYTDSKFNEAITDAANKYQPIGQYVLKTEIPSTDNLATKQDVAAVVVGYATETWVSDQGFLTEHQDISGKQDKIDDLKEIRDGAAAGATALQSIPEEYVTETELIDKGYLTEQSLNGYATESFVSEEIKKIVIPDAPNMDDYYTKGDIDTMIGNINNMIGQATDITNRILNKQ